MNIIELLLSCSSDVSIMKRYDDTQEQIVDIDSATEQDTFENNPMEGVSGYLHYYLRQVACPACVGENQEINVSMDLKLHEPTSQTHTSWIPSQGQCTNTFQYTNPSTNPISEGNTINVQSIHDISLHQSNPGTYSATVYETEYDRNYSHAAYSGDSLLFEFQSISGFDSVEPYTLLWVDPSYAFETPIRTTGSTFWWTPYGDQMQIFNITIAVYTWDGSQLIGYTSCSGADSGQMTIPGQYLSVYPSGSLAAVHLTRHKVELEPSNYFNSFIETHMEWEVIGTGHIE